MAMSDRIRKELDKSRELLWHFLLGERCYFCKKPLVPKEPIEFGNGYAQPVPTICEITVHHENENHDDNRKRNRKLAHQSCHKSHHAKIVFTAYNNGLTIRQARKKGVVGSPVIRAERVA